MPCPILHDGCHITCIIVPAGLDAGEAAERLRVLLDGLRLQLITTPRRTSAQWALAVLEVPHDVHVYPGSGHRFMTESHGAGAALAKLGRMSYQPEDAADSWARIFGFFGTYLEQPA